MAQVKVAIAGASRGAKFTWKGKPKKLASTGPGSFGVTFSEQPGTFVYAVVVFGNPADPWSAKITGGAAPHNHAGHMSPSGFDTTGDTPLTVI